MHNQASQPLKPEKSNLSISAIQQLWIAISIGIVVLAPLALFVVTLIRTSSVIDTAFQASSVHRTSVVKASGAEKKTTINMAATAVGVAASPSAPPFFVAPSRPRIILFGDSLTERSFDVPSGWGAALASNYSRRADVVNRGLSGYNTRLALKTMPYIFGPASASASGSGGAVAAAAASQVLFATLFFGANDAARLEGPSHSQRQHVPVPEYGENLRKMVSYMRDAGVQRIVLLTPPPVWEPGRKVHQISRMGEQAREWPLDRTSAVTAEYARAAAAVAADLGLPCLDLHTLIQQEDDWGERLLCDGLHFSPAGQERLGALLRELLQREWPDVRPEALPMQFPAWDAVNLADLEETFGGSS
ncbi:hypothetical protein Agub_g13049 [Astrephomene gubernaculifera]|uniref:SGNH hydrolase-type esterase domain-containing protein n=1 Tax=Astrephomene gubernaculifera TaxID=47775 RepID=A0AAD3E186_9CHLO|nr:hypothetical protein Agub_g13049 [Astrephomene gubernaculifera]